MSTAREINAVQRPGHAGVVIEFETVVTPGMEDAGLGALGEPVALYGELLTVSSGRTLGRAWSRVIVSAEVIRHGTASRVLIDSVLGAHRTVTVTSDRGFAQGAPVILLHVPYRAGALTFAPGSYRTIPDPNCPDRHAIRFLGTTFPLRLRRG